MKTLSIKDPWAWLICSKIKDVENRSWRTNYRGRILVHVPAVADKDSRLPLPYALPENRVTSAIIGEVNIIDCRFNTSMIWGQDFCWHWILQGAELYDKPILNVKGRLGLWEYNK